MKLDTVVERLNPGRALPYLFSTRQDAPERTRHTEKHPTNLIVTKRTALDSPRIIHGQKHVEIVRYMVRTYSNQSGTVLDVCAGGFTTGVACHLEDRQFIGIEMEPKHFALGTRRVIDLINKALAVWQLHRLMGARDGVP